MIQLIQDTKEKKGLGFEFYEGIEVISHKLKTGDYMMEGCPDIVIERKATTGELYMNLAKGNEQARFYRECERLQAYRHPYILCEFPESYLYEFPNKSNIPESKRQYLRVGPAYFRKLVYQLPEKFPPIKLVFVDNRVAAQDFIVKTFKDYLNGSEKKFNF